MWTVSFPDGNRLLPYDNYDIIIQSEKNFVNGFQNSGANIFKNS